MWDAFCFSLRIAFLLLMALRSEFVAISLSAAERASCCLRFWLWRRRTRRRAILEDVWMESSAEVVWGGIGACPGWLSRLSLGEGCIVVASV